MLPASFNPTDIDHIDIFPPIAVARLGDADPNDYYIGPEVPGVDPLPPDGKFRDKDGRIKRQAARFHAYAFGKNGKLLGELNSEQSTGYTLTWTVSVANKKAAWVKFRGKVIEETYELRNPNVQPYPYNQGQGSSAVYEYTNKRNKLIIEDSKVIQSGDTSTKDLIGVFDGGVDNEKTIPVTLGHLKVNRAGSLIFIAGNGDSQCVAGGLHAIPYPDLTEKFDSEFWYDCICDGNVELEIKHPSLHNPLLAAHKATITTAPPKFTPGLSCVASLYDLMEDVYERPKRAALGKAYNCGDVEYYKHIKPIFYGISLLSWTNQSVYEGHGPHKLDHFKDDLLKDPAIPNSQPIRKAIFDRVRAPIKHDDPQDPYIRNKQAYEYYMPRLAGNAGDNPEGLKDTRNNRDRWCSLTELQYDRLSKWADGKFTTGSPPLKVEEAYDKYPVDQQPTLLSRAALQWTTGAPLYPGMEAYWIVESSHMYEMGDVFRFNEGVKPGDLTKGLSLPWQADFYMWPHIRPDHIITEKEFNQTREDLNNNDSILPYYLTARELWHRGFKTHEIDETVGATEMVKKWRTLGFISKVALNRPQPPMDIYIETDRWPIGPKEHVK